MKNKQLKNIIFILGLTLSFFIGRESKEVGLDKSIQSNYNTETFKSSDLNNKTDFFNSIADIENKETITLSLTATDTVYRCGQSKIYHPSKSHGSFKRCKSKVYKLIVARAKKLGMRHCKCSD